MNLLPKFLQPKPAVKRERMAMDMPIVTETADERLMDIIERERIPSDVNQTMANAINGDLRYQGILFETMFDTWPRLQGDVDEICGGVSRNEVVIEPYSEAGEDPTESALAKAAFVKESLDAMTANAIMERSDVEGLIYNVSMSYFTGIAVQEVLWESNERGIVPNSTKSLNWRNFGYPFANDMVDRLMLNREGDYSFNTLEDFPPHKFIPSINKGHSGHASQAAPLRSLMTYWLGSVYGLKWLLNFGQIYGVPIRWANYSEAKDIGIISNMLKKIGSAGWAAMPPGTSLETIESSKSAQNLPQQALMDNADKACDIFVLGQTLTSDVGSSGSQALGNVHNEIRLDRIDTVGDYVSKTLKSTLIKSLLELNYGDNSESPTIKIRSKRSKDTKGMAETLKILSEALPGIPFSYEQISEQFDIAKPLNEEDTLISGPKQVEVEEEPKPEEEEPEKEVKASLATIKAAETRSNKDKLSNNVMENLTDVASEWLSGVKPAFDRLAGLALSGEVTDDDFLKVVVEAKNQLPELFDKLDTASLQTAFENSSGTAMMAGVEDSLRL
jgi:phage gp29-like protein